MRILFALLFSISSFLFSQFAFAQDVVHIGLPASSVSYTTVTTQEVGNYAVIPETVHLQPVQNYYFVNVGGEEQVCRAKKVRTIKHVAGRTIRYGKRKLYCYPSKYFMFN